RGVTTTRAVNCSPFLRWRAMVPSHLPSRSAASSIMRGLPAFTSSGGWRISELALSTTPPGAFVPEQNLAVEILADDGILGGGFQNVLQESGQLAGGLADSQARRIGPDCAHLGTRHGLLLCA